MAIDVIGLDESAKRKNAAVVANLSNYTYNFDSFGTTLTMAFPKYKAEEIALSLNNIGFNVSGDNLHSSYTDTQIKESLAPIAYTISFPHKAVAHLAGSNSTDLTAIRFNEAGINKLIKSGVRSPSLDVFAEQMGWNRSTHATHGRYASLKHER